MDKITRISEGKEAMNRDGTTIRGRAIIAAIEKVRPVIDEDGEWSCADEIFCHTTDAQLTEEEVVRLMAYQPVLAGRIQHLFLENMIERAHLYLREWRTER